MEEDYKSGEDFGFDPRSGDCFANFAQFHEPTLNLNALRMGIVRNMCGIGEEAMASPKMLVAKRRHLGGLKA